MISKIDSIQNPLIKKASKLISSRSFRYSQQSFVIEGLRLCSDAIKSKAEISELMFTSDFALKHGEELKSFCEHAEKSFEISPAAAKKICDTQNPQGLFCICRMKQNDFSLNQGGRYIALENIQDPSNLGTIARTAEALGADGLILSRGCCDIYNPKALRGSMGAFFRLPYVTADDFCEYLKTAQSDGFQIMATSPDSSCEDISSAKKSDSLIAIIGNEGDGISPDAFACADKAVTIKMRGRAESLNAAAAAAIVMYEVLK